MSRSSAASRSHGRSERQRGPEVFTLLAECFYLLRAAPLAVLSLYLIGTVPFVLGLMYFFGDMLQNAYALRVASPYALGLALLFLWMCAWQGRFAEKLLEIRTGRPPPRRRFKEWVRWLRLQIGWQCTAVWVLPIAAVLTIPFVSMLGFYQSLRVLPELDRPDAPTLTQRAWHQGSLWLKNQHLCLAAFLLFAFVIWINWLTFLTFGPFLLKWFFGIDSVFTRSAGMTQASVTTFLVALALTYLTVDPLLKAFYVLRCFYGEARKTGEDVLVSLNALRSSTKVVTLLVLLACLLPASLGAREPTDPARPSMDAGPSPEAIDTAIETTLREPRFAWRLPRPDEEQEEPAGWVTDFFNWIEGIQEAFGDWLENLFNSDERRESVRDSGPSGSNTLVNNLLLFLLILFLVVTVLLIVRSLVKARRPDADDEDLGGASASRMTDIEIESASADERSRNEWLVLADDFAARGDFRRAVRAVFLGHLSILAEARLIRLAIHKTNHDYRRELASRPGIDPGIRPSFQANSLDYERVWYGFETADRDLFLKLRGEVERVDAQLGVPAA